MTSNVNTNPNPNATDCLIWLSELCGAGSPLPKRVYEAFGGDMTRAYTASAADYAACGFSPEEAALLNEKSFDRTNVILDFCAENQVGLLCFGSEYYPARLYEIAAPPPVLYYRGHIERLGAAGGAAGGAFLTAVGSRSCSESAYRASYALCYKLASAGISIVTGLALGIDTACTLGALDSGGFSVGVLGCGINVLYPADSGALFGRMFRSGLVLSEFSPYTEPRGAHFPIRNRVMAALGNACFVAEAGAESGALITADYARELGRRIYVFPGSVDDPRCRGSNGLLRAGAAPVLEAEDILSELCAVYPAEVDTASSDSSVPIARRMQARRRASSRKGVSGTEAALRELPRRKRKLAARTARRKAPETAPERASETEPAKEAPAPAAQSRPEADRSDFSDLSHLSEPERTVYEALRTAAAPPDLLVRGTALTEEQIIEALTVLEIEGLVRALPGGMYEAV